MCIRDRDHTTLCIHRAPLGTHERFIGFLIEHYAGNFPLWLTPTQMVIIPISDKFNNYSNLIYNKLKNKGFRVKIDQRKEKMGAKIRTAELNKIPIMIIIGERESNENKISFRRKFQGDQGSVDVDKFIEQMNDEIVLRK